MKTSAEILKRTGLKSAKTLTRWAKRGIIPVPYIQTHPSGRGKIGYWPDWVLDRCLRIVELRKKGRSLDSALFELELQGDPRGLAVEQHPGPGTVLTGAKPLVRLRFNQDSQREKDEG